MAPCSCAPLWMRLHLIHPVLRRAADAHVERRPSDCSAVRTWMLGVLLMVSQGKKTSQKLHRESCNKKKLQQLLPHRCSGFSPPPPSCLDLELRQRRVWEEHLSTFTDHLHPVYPFSLWYIGSKQEENRLIYRGDGGTARCKSEV